MKTREIGCGAGIVTVGWGVSGAGGIGLGVSEAVGIGGVRVSVGGVEAEAETQACRKIESRVRMRSFRII